MTDATTWEPVPDYPGTEFHALVESEGVNAGLFRVGEAMTFDWTSPSREVFVVLEGEARIEISGGPALELKPRSLAAFPQGLKTTWHVTAAPFKDMYVIT